MNVYVSPGLTCNIHIAASMCESNTKSNNTARKIINYLVSHVMLNASPRPILRDYVCIMPCTMYIYINTTTFWLCGTCGVHFVEFWKINCNMRAYLNETLAWENIWWLTKISIWYQLIAIDDFREAFVKLQNFHWTLYLYDFDCIVSY